MEFKGELDYLKRDSDGYCVTHQLRNALSTVNMNMVLRRFPL